MFLCFVDHAFLPILLIHKYRGEPCAARFKTVKQQDPDATNQIIAMKATRIAALVNEPPKRFLEIDKTLIIINSDIFEHLAPETICL